jgi:hypothetical protein
LVIEKLTKELVMEEFLKRPFNQFLASGFEPLKKLHDH